MSLLPNHKCSGFSLIELAVVLMIIVILASFTAFAIPAWRNASSRAVCITHQVNVQHALRSWVALYAPSATTVNFTSVFGTSSTSLMPYPSCPAGGTYTPTATATGVAVLNTGERYLGCSISGHNATNIQGW
jgi:prepilin-type N-terminal cleavage/methylation domain-containing protein